MAKQVSTFDAEGNGEWGGLQSWPLIPLHMIVLPDGKIFSYGTNEYGKQGAAFFYDVYDPETDVHYTLPNETMTDIFCSHMALDPKTGNVLIFGGDARGSGGNALDGVNMLSIFNPKTLEVTAATDSMEYARWYPTVLTLSSGEILTIGGRNASFDGSTFAEVYNAETGFRTLTNAEFTDFRGDASLDNSWWYPHAWQRSDGNVVVIEAYGNDVYILDPESDGNLQKVGQIPFASHKMDPSIMYEQDKALMADIDGGLWSVDMSSFVPTFTKVAQMPDGRVAGNMTMLPDGSVIITGGTDYDTDLFGQGSDAVDLANAQHEALRFVPGTGELLVLAGEELARLYHSAAVLLDDGRILSAGGGAPGPLQNLNGEFFTPDIYYNEDGTLADRPEIDSVTKIIDPGQTITLTVDDAYSIAKVTALKSAAVTHSSDPDARFISLQFTVVDEHTIIATTPDANVMIPGNWRITVVDDAGVPSVSQSIGVGVADDFFDGYGPLPYAPSPGREDYPDINGAFAVDAVVRFDDLDGGNWQRVFDFGNGPDTNNILLTQTYNSNTMRFSIWQDGVDHAIEAPGSIIEGETALWSARVDSSGKMTLMKNGEVIASGQGVVPRDEDRHNEFVGGSNWEADDKLIGEVSSLSFTGNVTYPTGDAAPTTAGLAFFAQATVRYDDLDGGYWQRIFDYGNGPDNNDIWLGQRENSNDMRFEVLDGATKYSVTATGAIVEGETATWTAQVTDTGLMQIYKNGVLVAEGQGIVPPDIDRENQLIGQSNWTWDTPLIGKIDSITVDLDGSDETAPEPTSDNLAFFAQATARFDDLDGGYWQRIFDYGNGPDNNDIWLGQRENSKDMRFEVLDGATKYSVTATGAIIEGETATWTAQVTDTGLMQIYKNGVLVAEGQGIVPPDVERENQFVGQSNWTWDTPLIGKVDAITVDLDGELEDDCCSVDGNDPMPMTETANSDTEHAHDHDHDHDHDHETMDMAPTAITVSNLDVVDNSTSGAIVAMLGAVDPTSDDVFSFELVSTSDWFEIADGAIVVREGVTLDFETATRTSETIEIRVTDSTGNAYSQHFTFNLTDAPDPVYGTEGKDTLQGTDGDDIIHGFGGKDKIDSKQGFDIVYGGDGNDVYIISSDSGEKTFVELAGEGMDTVKSVASHSLAGNIEALKLTGKADVSATGNDLANKITGNGGHNVIEGGGGGDRLKGGGGADVFVFANTADSAVNADGRDLIVHFSQRQGDRIDLGGIDADINSDGDDAFGFIGAKDFSGHGGELRYQLSGKHMIVEGDVDGDGNADFAIEFDRAMKLEAHDFIL